MAAYRRSTTSALARRDAVPGPHAVRHAHHPARAPRPSSHRTREIASQPAAPRRVAPRRPDGRFHMVCVMKAAPARPTLEQSTVCRPDGSLDTSPAPQRPGDLAGHTRPQKGDSAWTTPNGCAAWPSTTPALPKQASEEPGPGPASSTRKRWRSSASPRWSRSVALFQPGNLPGLTSPSAKRCFFAGELRRPL